MNILEKGKKTIKKTEHTIHTIHINSIILSHSYTYTHIHTSPSML